MADRSSEGHVAEQESSSLGVLNEETESLVAVDVVSYGRAVGWSSERHVALASVDGVLAPVGRTVLRTEPTVLAGLTGLSELSELSESALSVIP